MSKLKENKLLKKASKLERYHLGFFGESSVRKTTKYFLYDDSSLANIVKDLVDYKCEDVSVEDSSLNSAIIKMAEKIKGLLDSISLRDIEKILRVESAYYEDPFYKDCIQAHCENGIPIDELICDECLDDIKECLSGKCDCDKDEFREVV